VILLLSVNEWLIEVCLFHPADLIISPHGEITPEIPVFAERAIQRRNSIALKRANEKC
jgi:hypothetical protein